MQHRLPASVALAIGLLAAAAALMPALWVASQHLHVMAHEGGHAFMGSALGHRVSSVSMNVKGTGLTMTAGTGGLRIFLTSFSGYLASSAFGVGAAKLISMGHGVAVLWLLILGLAILLLVAQGLFARFCIACAGVLLFLAARYTTPGAQLAIVYGVTWFLLISGVTVSVKHWKTSGDAANLKKQTHLPRVLWSMLWLIGCVAALVYGAGLLV
ncbi:MAG TPA: M50 family metallopeptidase [Streptosporangiaceae bacterium]